ncbi:Transmembrane protein 87B [Vitis vinifera]|uniref:Transmembrane protein 87B n=1 Tax=Vitis vinifera TaxID=29760 RepID=A0A438H9N2_VITVI|nr:Transmembrane protein 87B [Vitis vinifera]
MDSSIGGSSFSIQWLPPLLLLLVLTFVLPSMPPFTSTTTKASGKSGTPTSSPAAARALSLPPLPELPSLTPIPYPAAADQHSDMGHSTGLIQVVIFEAADRDNIGGSAYGGQRSICCTPDLAKLEGCKQGEVIRIPSATDINWPIVLNVQFSGKSLSTIMNGKTLWKNPDGYLPGRMAPLMKFYVYMSLAYVLLCVTWFFQYMRFWKDILQLQHCITVVIALGLFEMILWYFEFENFNRTGTRPVGITTWVVTVGAVRRTVSRLLILSVSMGYGVVRPTLGGLTSKVLLLGITYFVATELLDITEYVGTINDVSGRARLFLVLPDAFLDAFLILWIFTSLSKTLEQLQAKRSSVKLDTYRKFSNSLAVAVIASVVWIGYELIPDRTWGFMLGSIGLYWFASVLRSFRCPGPAFVFLASELSVRRCSKKSYFCWWGGVLGVNLTMWYNGSIINSLRSHCLHSLGLIQLSSLSLFIILALGKEIFERSLELFLFQNYDMLYWVHCQLPDLGNATTYFKRYPSLCWVITLGPCLTNSKLSYCTREATLWKIMVYFKATDPFNERWQSAWIITAFWDILAFGLLCVICYLWAPSQSSQRYAYSDEKGEEFDDEETQSLTRGKPEGDISLAKQDNLEDEEEEDKRE